MTRFVVHGYNVLDLQPNLQDSAVAFFATVMCCNMLACLAYDSSLHCFSVIWPYCKQYTNFDILKFNLKQ